MQRLEVPTSGGSIAVTRRGSGPVVVLLHGLPGSGAAWEPVAKLLTDVDLVIPDLLGFGASAKPVALDDLHAGAQAQAVLKVLDALGVADAVVIGHDFGGPVGLALTGMAPHRVRGLGLLATNAFADTPVPIPLNTVTWPLVGSLAARLMFSPPSLRMMLATGSGKPRTPLDHTTYLGDAAQRRTIAAIFAGSLREMRSLYTPIQNVLETVDVPGFVLWGDKDPFFSMDQGRRTASAFRAPFVPLSGAGHFLPAERPADVADAIRKLVHEIG